jgi:hypothetical protein
MVRPDDEMVALKLLSDGAMSWLRRGHNRCAGFIG